VPLLYFHLHFCHSDIFISPIMGHIPSKCGPDSDWLRAGRSGDRIPVGASFFTPVQTGPGTHPASCKIGTGSFPGVKSGRGGTLTPHPFLVPWSRKGRAIPLLPLWAVQPVQSPSACIRVTFTFYLFIFLFSNSQSKSCQHISLIR
jgi:hypothetical protein